MSFLDEVFTGKDLCREAVALALVRELRRISAGSDKGKAFRDRVYEQGVEPSDEPYFYENVMRRMFHVEIRVPMVLNLDKLPANTLTVHDPAGSGLFDEEGRYSEKGAAMLNAYRALKHGMDDPATACKFAAAVPTFADEHLTKATAKTASKARNYSTDVLRLWSERITVVCATLSVQETPQAKTAMKRLQSQLHLIDKVLQDQPSKSAFNIERVRDQSTEFVENTPLERAEILFAASRDLLDKQVKVSVAQDCEALIAMLESPPADVAERCDKIIAKRHRRLSNQHVTELALLESVKKLARDVKSYLSPIAPRQQWLELPLSKEPI